MIKSIVALSLLFFSLSAQALPGLWDKYIGCYVTTSLNGAPINPGPYGPLTSEIKREKFGYLTDLNGRELEGVTFLMYEGFRKDTYYFDGLGVVFDDYGNTTRVPKGLHYQLSGEFLYSVQNLIVAVTESLEIQELDASHLQIKILRDIQNGPPDMNADKIFVLEKISCN